MGAITWIAIIVGMIVVYAAIRYVRWRRNIRASAERERLRRAYDDRQTIFSRSGSKRLCFIVCLLVMWRGAVADQDCIRWAQMVERIEAIEPENREKHFAMWRAYTADNKITRMYLLSAINWVTSGGTSNMAWHECVSF